MLKLSDKRRYHFTAKKTLRLKPRDYVQGRETKPQGLWYAPGTAWIDFLRPQPGFAGYIHGTDTLHVHEVKLAKGAKILRLDTPAMIEGFVTAFQSRRDNFGTRVLFIDWSIAARVYQGIEIIPFQPSVRLNPRHEWYNPWDLASGCVWDITAIKEISYVGSMPAP